MVVSKSLTSGRFLVSVVAVQLPISHTAKRLGHDDIRDKHDSVDEVVLVSVQLGCLLIVSGCQHTYQSAECNLL